LRRLIERPQRASEQIRGIEAARVRMVDAPDPTVESA